jgi:hypothetical protein
MRFMKSVIAATLALPMVAVAQADSTRSQQGRTMLSFGLGVTGTREASVVSGQTTARTTGQLASLSFTHFVSPGIAFDIAGAVLDADASTGYSNTSAAAVTALVFGLSYSPPKLALTKSMRPYVSAAIGPYIHFQSETSAYGSAQTSLQSHVGARLGAGMNVYFARILALQLEGNYHSVKPFDTVNGATRNPTGWSMTVGLGLAWGGK